MAMEEVLQHAKMVDKMAAVPPDIVAKVKAAIKDRSSPYGPSPRAVLMSAESSRRSVSPDVLGRG